MIKIMVLPEDIAGGVRRNPWSCPVARATQRILGNYYILAGNDVIYIGEEEIPVSRAVRRAIRKYDGGGIMKPFSFWLRT
jgi:hypothetical protein